MKQKVIKPYHLFQHKDSWYVINIEGMYACRIDDAVVEVLKNISSDPTISLNAFMEEQLKKIGLITEEGERTPRQQKDIKKAPIPVSSMSLFLTQCCNMKCVYCYGGGGEYGTSGFMDEKTAYRSVDWLIEQSGESESLNIGLFGGEPLLNFSLMKNIVAYTEKRVREVGKEVIFNMTTNATLLDGEKIAFIKEHKIITMISFDGPKELQDKQRPFINGHGSYDSIVPKIKEMLLEVPQTIGHAVIVGNTDPEMVKDALRHIGFSKLSTKLVSQSLFAGKEQIKTERATEHSLQAMEQKAETWIDLIKNRESVALKIFKEESGIYHSMIALLHNIKKQYACGAGLDMVAVSCEGDIYLCHRFVGQDEYKLGNVFRKNWKQGAYQTSPLTDKGNCTKCFAKYYCAGGCKHDNLAAQGSVTTPAEDMCRLRCRELELGAIIACSLNDEDKSFLMEQEIITPKPCPLDF